MVMVMSMAVSVLALAAVTEVGEVVGVRDADL